MSDMPNTPARIGEFLFYCVRFPGDDEGGDIFASRSSIDELYAEAHASDGILKFEGAYLDLTNKHGKKSKMLCYVGRAPLEQCIVRYHDNLSDPFAPDGEDDDEQDDDSEERDDAPVIPMPEPPKMPSLR